MDDEKMPGALDDDSDAAAAVPADDPEKPADTEDI